MKQENSRKIRLLTQSAFFLALLIAAQYATSGFSQLVTGSVVNFILVAAALTASYPSGLIIAFFSPIFAKLIGIGPIWPLIPVVMLGNAAIVSVFYFLLKDSSSDSGAKKYVRWLAAIVLGAAAKFAVIYLGAVKLVLPMLADSLPAPQIAKMTAMFSLPQLITAAIGGAIAMLAVPLIRSALAGRTK